MIERHNKILELIQKHSIDTQEELAKHLSQAGYQVTQATVSRDIKRLRLVKRVDSAGKSRYVANENPLSEDGFVTNHYNLFASSVIGIDYAQNLIVIKTHPGMAQAIAAAIDSQMIENVLGSIAGDDTILLVARDNKAAEITIKRFQGMR